MSTPTPTTDRPAPGTYLYSMHAQKGYLNGYTDQGEAIVEVMFKFDTMQGWEEMPGPIEIWQKWFTSPPVEKKAEEVEALLEKEMEIKARIHQLEVTERQALRTYEDRTRFLKIHPKLARLDDFLSGKFTHIVRWDWYKIEIIEIASWLKDTDGLRLLTLYGKTNGELNWRLGEYSDHSGGNHRCTPCFSFDEALEEIQRVSEERFAIVRQDPKARTDTCRYSVEAYRKYGLTPPQDILDILAAQQERNIRSQQEAKKKEIVELEAKLNALKAQIPTPEEHA